MKKRLLTLIYLVVSLLFVNAQSFNGYFKEIKNVTTYQVPTNSFSKNYLFASSNYEEAKLECDFKQLEGKTIEKVSYVYSYSKNLINQERINQERFRNLKNLVPFLFDNMLIGWEAIEQGKFLSADKKAALFHGFVITYRETSEETVKEEVDYLDKILTETTDVAVTVAIPVISEKVIKNKLVPVTESIEERSIRTIMREVAGLIDSLNRLGISSSYRVYPNNLDSTIIYLSDFIPLMPTYQLDSTVFKVLDRNKQWKNNLIVHDVTGSMSPYTGQVLLWHKLNYEKSNKQNFVFFNDGDKKPDSKKVTGKVGGLYFASNSEEVDDVLSIAKKAMSNGYGGDCPENNIEAILYGLKNAPNSDNIILIADNFATPRDLELTKKIGKPVKIILCGTYGFINVNYLNLARATGGSVHTIESDLENLIQLKEGEKIEIDGKQYVINDGKFVQSTTK